MSGTAGHPVLKPVASAYFASTMGPSVLAGNSACLPTASSALGRWGNEVPTIKQLLILLNISTWDEAGGQVLFLHTAVMPWLYSCLTLGYILSATPTVSWSGHLAILPYSGGGKHLNLLWDHDAQTHDPCGTPSATPILFKKLFLCPYW